MVVTETGSAAQPVRRSRRPMVVSSIVVVVLAVSGIAWLARSGGGANHVDMVKQIVADYDFADEDEVPFSYADVDRWLGNFASDAQILGSVASDPEVREILAAFDIWDEQVEVLAEPWELDADQVRAELQHTDAFHGAGGVVMTATHTYRFNDDDEVVTTYLRTLNYADYKAFEAAFIAWDENVGYPGEVLERGDGGLRWNAVNAAISVQTVDEFLAYSDEYPITG